MEVSKNDLILYVVTATILLLAIGFFIIVFIQLYTKRRRQFMAEKKDIEQRYAQTLLQSQLEIQEQTLKTISQEIHDNVGQVLTLAKLNLATTTAASEEGNGKINTSRQLIGKAIQDLRDLSKSLNTEYVEEMGLIRSIEYEFEMLKKTGTIETQFTITGNTIRLEKQKELILFRIVQESIHNIMKHADAKILSASIEFQENSLIILIKDNGKGFDISPLNDEENRTFGLGLRNMKNRATLIGAQFSIVSSIGSGTELYIHLPFNGTEHEGTTKN